MVVDTLIEAAAIGGVAAMWTYSTLKIGRLWAYFTYGTLKICEKIVSTPKNPPLYRCELCSRQFTSDFMTEREGVNCYIHVCKRCEDEELDTRYGDEKST